MGLNPQLLQMVSQAKSKYAGNSGKAIKPKEGRNTYRIVAPTHQQAPWVDPVTGKWWADLGVHWIKSDPNGKPIAVVGDCDTVYQQPSPLNTAIEMAIHSAVDEDSKKLYEEWKARKSILLNVVDRSTPGDDPDVLELTTTTFSKVLELYTMYAEAGQDITDPASGQDIVITRTGKGLNTNYDVAIAPLAPGASHKPVPLASLQKATDLMDFIQKNYFRGEEQKALNAIAQIAGVALPRLGAAPAGALAARTPTAALTSASASVAEADPVTTVAPAVTAPVTPAAAAAPVVDQAAIDLAARRAAILKRQQEELAEIEAAEAAAASKAAAPAPAAAPAATVLPEAEVDSILSELDNLVG
ncbi:hypothetical protein [Ancylobacter rudongensis]|uniref:Uncharacterized protein n=1 Tax=Ancylobacter rudongensis TaxID=177413 RepID=A0A1G4UQ61_9HYPH|nr:hypothetical protein [Ancylobacter rudongensis]SCW95786.1 hypothetical protein SAMN05660859_0118 [Ancylobacter rudongensis]